MRYALVNPRWSFEGSTYFGCPEPHFPLELLYAQQTLRRAGHQVVLIDAFMNRSNTRKCGTASKALKKIFWWCQPHLRTCFGDVRSLSCACRETGLRLLKGDRRRW